MSDFLNWRTDPFLVDPEPFEQNTWLTANELLESGRRDSFITFEGQLLLYPLMIRKIDFISGERILQSFPYILLDNEFITKIRKQSLTLAEKTHHYFLGSNYNRSIREWQKKIIDYLEEQQRLPFPLFRLSDDWMNYFSKKESIKFQSARGEDFQIPLYLSENLAYLTGVVMGDGHLANYFVNIIDASQEHIENLAKLLEKNFQSHIETFKHQNANAWNVNLLGKWIVRFFNFLSGQLINARKYPALREPLLFQTNDSFRQFFYTGLMDSDGTYKATIGFGTASKKLLTDFSLFLNQHEINYRYYNQSVFGGTTYSFNITGESRKRFAQLIGSRHPVKQGELETLLKRRINRFAKRGSTLIAQGYWGGQVTNFNKLKLIDNYFNYSLTPQFALRDIGFHLKVLRTKHKLKQKALLDELNIPQTLYSKYERNITSVPIATLTRILFRYNETLDDFLKDFQKINVQLNNSFCKLATQPSNLLLKLLQGLQFKSSYILIRGLSDIDLSNYKNNLCDYFGINIENIPRFNNAILYEFVKEFCILQ